MAGTVAGHDGLENIARVLLSLAAFLSRT